MLKTKRFGGWRLVNTTWGEWLEELEGIIEGEKFKTVMTPNPEQIVLASKEPRFGEALEQADYLLPDGAGLVWASGVKERLTGADSVREILLMAAAKNKKVMLIGGNYKERAGRLNVDLGGVQTEIYYTKGYQNANNPSENEEKALRVFVGKSKPDIVLVAFGAPKQEYFVIEKKAWLEENGVKMIMCVGGAFDFLLGRVRRAPSSWQKLGLEWLWRLGREPWRWYRQLALPKFVWLVMRGRFK